MFCNQINMTIFNENKARPDLDSASLSNNTKMFFDMTAMGSAPISNWKWGLTPL